MSKAMRKLCLVLALTLTAAAMSRTPAITAVAHAYDCPYEYRPCAYPFLDCCCDKGVFCVANQTQCDQICDPSY